MMTRCPFHDFCFIFGSMVGTQTSETSDGGSGGLLLSACRRHLSPLRGVGTFAASRSAGKRRRLEQQQQLPGGQSHQAAGDADGSMGSSGKKPRAGPFRVLLTTGKTPSSADAAVGSTTSSSRGTQNRKAATAAGSARLLSSVAMDLAHSLALQSSSSLPSPSCRGCGANSGTSNTRNQQNCQCVDVVYILHASAASVGGDGEGRAGDDAEEEEVGADLFPLRCRRVDDSSMNDTTGSNDNDEADDGADPATNPRSASSSSSPQSSSSPSWDEGALSRIQIRRMRDGTDLVRYLATVPLLPPHQQPRRGIVLNDIGSFVLGNAINGNGGGSSGGTVGNGGSTQSVASSLGPSYYTIDSSTVLTQILSILGNTADYLERQRRKALKSADNTPAATSAAERTSDAISSHGDEFSLLVTMDGNAYSQLPPHIKPVLQNWLPVVGTLHSSKDDDVGPSKNGSDSGWSLDLHRDGWRLSRSFSDGPATCSAAASCTIKQSQESADGMPQIFWRSLCHHLRWT